MNSKKVRKKFLKYFTKKGHKVVSSSSLITDDPSVLFTTAGMQQFKANFLGESHVLGKRVTSIQKCLRTSDIEEVGDESHLTFFEMLGSFSFGDYWKKEAIDMAEEFLVKKCKLNKDKLYFTYFKGEGDIPEDAESKDLLKGKKTFGCGKEDNFWGPTGNKGPCGPTVEIHYELKGSCGDNCDINCDCGRFVEIWNLVFNQYYQDENGNLAELEQKGVDTGMGFERLVTVLQKKNSVYQTDLFNKFLQQYTKEHRIIADHMRASLFLIAEGIEPSKTDKGYILRRLIRRIVRINKLTNIDYIQLGKDMINYYKDIYPELIEEKIIPVIEKEVEMFNKILEGAETIIIEKASQVIDSDHVNGYLTGSMMFDLYSTKGIPRTTIEEIAKTKEIPINNPEDFDKIQKEHQKKSRAGIEKKFGGVGKDAGENAKKLHTATHLLHKALRDLLGEDVQQMGSDITEERLRFDFSFDRKLTEEELKSVEDKINKVIGQSLEVVKEEMKLEEALKSGAMSFFKEKYPDVVNVYSIGDYSKEICAGPHVNNTKEINGVIIKKQESIGKGIKRIKAVIK